MPKSAKRLLIFIPAILLACALLLFITARIFSGKIEPEVRNLAIRYLQQRFNAKVTLEHLQIILPRISPVRLLWRGGSGIVAGVKGQGLSISYEGRSDIPPLLTVAKFECKLDLGTLRQAHPRVARIALDGVTIVIPPKRDSARSQKEEPQSANSPIIDNLDFSNTRLVVLPKLAGRKPLEILLKELHLESAGIGQRMKYQASFVNPRPPGQIDSQGTFGPWQRDEPGDTPLEGDYDFSNADLGVFKAIAGTLHSNGHFGGTLSAVRVRGEANVPDFRLKNSGNPVPLETQFDAIVDGVNGNTVLEPVHARLLNTFFQTSGAIIEREPNGRRAIDLSVIMPQGHVEDCLQLAMKGKPFMSGVIHMQAKISIPPLGGDVKEKLRLDGTYDIARGDFLRESVQDKIDELSRRGQGRPEDKTVENVFSRMSGSFHLEDAVMTFSRLEFEVPGAAVAVHGQYRMAGDVLDFHGDLKLQAKVSQTLAGWKHWLAVPLDPLFEKNGASTFLRIEIVGSAKSPKFGRDHGE
jgi:hypothetical protein